MTNIGALLPELYTVYSQDIPPKFPLPNPLVGFPIMGISPFHALMTWRVAKSTDIFSIAEFVSLRTCRIRVNCLSGCGSETGSDLFDIKKCRDNAFLNLQLVNLS
jgi:hypothetical protein